MSWQEGIATVVLLLGLEAGALLMAQRPTFWMEFDLRLGKGLLPRVLNYVTRRMPTEGETEWREKRPYF